MDTTTRSRRRQDSRRASRRAAPGPGAALLAITLTLLAWGCGAEPADQRAAERRARETGYRGFLIPDPPAKPDFVLTDTRGEPFAFRAETDGFATLLFFGYTHCPDVCPVHMAGIAAVKRELPIRLQRRLKVVFVTTDPARDTPERLRGWLDAFDPEFVGLWGPIATVDSIQVRFGLPPAVRPEGRHDEYEVGHASQVTAFSPDGALRVLYPFGTRQADWRHDLEKLAALAGG